MLDIECALDQPDRVVIDLRSTDEFRADHLPGAINVPLLGDFQRAMVGYLFRQVSPEAALDQGRAFVLERVEALVHGIADAAGWPPPTCQAEDFGARVRALAGQGLANLEGLLEPTPLASIPKRPVILHCWRGGLRSRSVVALMRSLGLDRAVGLTGGYKAYRHHVLGGLAGWNGPTPYILHGLTGVGKTWVLREIEALRPGWTIDLEGLAGHRSSLLGMVGRSPCAQKTFDTRLWGALKQPRRGPLVLEGESRKIGDVTLPAEFWGAMEGGVPIWLHAPTGKRVELLIEDYLGDPANRAPLRHQLIELSGHLAQDIDWVGLFDAGRERELVGLLLERHYDPLYKHTAGIAAQGHQIDSSSPERAAAECVAWIEACEAR